MKLSVEIQRRKEAVIVRCRGRIVYRNEARAVSRLVMQSLQDWDLAVLELAGVEAIDSAGLGELVLLHMYVEGHGKIVKLAAVPPEVLELLELTNLASIFEICPSVEEALGLPSVAN